MQTAKSDFIHRLLLWAAVIALGNFIVVLAHLWLVVRIQPDFPKAAIPGLILVNLLPVSGVLALIKEGIPQVGSNPDCQSSSSWFCHRHLLSFSKPRN